MHKITFNGKIYNDIAEMPATERQAYEQFMAMFADKYQNGIPDILEGDIVGNLINFATTSTVIINGQATTYDSIPPELQAKLNEGMENLRNMGITFPSRAPAPDNQDKAPQWMQEIRPSKPIIQSPSAIQEETGQRRLIILFVLVSLLAFLGMLVIYYRMR